MKRDRLMTWYTLLLVPAGVIINIALSNLALYFEWPVFLDSVGTILSAALGGYLPGIFVGFISNLINGINDTITLYYGIISILIAVSASAFAQRRYFNKIGKSALSALFFAVLGGGLGSVLTWLLYGFSFGSGISAPYAGYINATFKISEFWSQFIADMSIDIIDKFISVAVVYIVIRFLPTAFLSRFPDGKSLTRNGEEYAARLRMERRSRGKNSLRTKMVAIIVAAATVLGVFATTISYIIYKDTMIEKYLHTNSGVVDLMVWTIDGDRIQTYLETGFEGKTYKQTEANLEYIRSCFSEVEYMYVYQIREDGCYAVFDLDTPDLPGNNLGDRIDFDSSFLPYLDDLLAGRDIEPVISDETYGWLMTIYKPILNSAGECVAYAAADISMDDIVSDRLTYIIKMISLQFGAAIIIAAFTVWFVEKKIVRPINSMTDATSGLEYDSDEKRVMRSGMIRALDIHTGDEIEELYMALVKNAADVEHYIGDIRKQTALIEKMRDNTIVSFANMVENRDNNTGEHIRHTAGYVQIIVDKLIKEGAYSDILTSEYVKKIIKSAPLHDIGKISVPDSILNKPGKLTPEEFDEMKKHTVAGRDILMDVVKGITGDNYLLEAVDMAMSHHEKWNGKGYPLGLSGTDIPLSARIMSVADVFDALISKRSYKEALPFDEAIEIIRADSGHAFDPTVVSAFLSCSEQIRRISTHPQDHQDCE